MVWIIVGIILTIIIVRILVDTHVKSFEGFEAVEEYDIGMPWQLLLLILVVELIPFVNIIAFTGFLMWYGGKLYNKPSYCFNVQVFIPREGTLTDQIIKTFEKFYRYLIDE